MTDKDIIEMAQKAGLHMATDVNWMPIISLKYAEKFAELVAAHEREACAKLCDDLADKHEQMNQWDSYKTADCLSQAIRARGKK